MNSTPKLLHCHIISLEAGKSASAELKARQTALDKALKETTEAREAKAAMTGELKALKSHNEQLAALLAGKKEPEELGKRGCTPESQKIPSLKLKTIMICMTLNKLRVM